MSLEDEIRAQKAKMQADKDAAERQQRLQKELQEARNKNGMNYNHPILVMPSADLQAVINETMSSMVFDQPKIVRTMPDNNALVRKARDNEKPDTYSFDVVVHTSTSKDDKSRGIWFFNNGAVAYVLDPNNGYAYYSNLTSPSVTAAEVRQKIIETIAARALEKNTKPQSTANSGNSTATSKSGACYIATAVYGSYDCPQVWVLRRFRDNVLMNSFWGRFFVKTYYAISPSLIRWFGDTEVFQRFWRGKLDKFVSNLRKKGFSDKEYMD